MVGVFPGKFLPPHRGHLTGILRAHALCDELIVVVCERFIEDGKLCLDAGLPYMSGKLRQRWLSRELSGMNIRVLLLDESSANPFPDGWPIFADLVRKLVVKPFGIIFGGETEYRDGHAKNFPGVEYIVLDPSRSKWNISATEIRSNPYKNWDFIVGAARPFFAKRVLITGTESCGKTTLVKKLAKVFYTSWSEEAGRTYQERFIGNEGSTFTLEDFNRIAHLQYEQDQSALETSNRVCFFDTDAVVTRFFSDFFMGEIADRVDGFIDPSKYDLVIALKPTVKWVDDGMRDTGEQGVRDLNFEQLMFTYSKFGFDVSQFVVIDSPDYYERLEISIKAIEDILS